MSVLYPLSGNLFAGTIGGGIYRTNDFGANWTEINSGGLRNRDVRAFASINGRVFAGTFSGKAYRSTNNGVKWEEVSAGLNDIPIRSLEQCGGNILAGTFQGMYLSTDNGNSWSSPEGELTGLNVTSFTPGPFIKNVDDFFAGTFGGEGIYKSNDYGITWTPNNSGLTSHYVYALLANNEILYAGTEGSGVFTSTDNGETWSTNESDISNQAVHSFAAIGKVVFAGTNENGIYRSSNNGESWEHLNSDITSKYINCMQVIENTLVVGAFGKGVFYSTDLGATWREYNSGLQNKNVNSLLRSGNNLLAGTYGSSVWVNTAVPLEVSENVNGAVALNRLTCYPNPATNTLTVDRTTLQFPENAAVQYTLSTLIGGKVMEFTKSERVFTVPLDGLQSGVYSLTADVGSYRAAVMVTVME